MNVKVLLVGCSDRQFEALLRASGVRFVSITEADVSALLNNSSPPPGNAVLIDLRGRADLPQYVSALKRQHPSVGVVIVASRLDPGLMLEAMRAGVSEWVVEPVTQAELAAALTRVGTLGGNGRPAGQVFAFLGAKGGVGTTTMAVNVAAALAKLAPSSPLLIDLHAAFGDAAIFLGAEPRFSIVDALENTQRLDEVFFRGLVARTKSGVELLASSDRLVPVPFDAARIRAVIDFAAHHYARTVLDVPRSEAAALDALEAATGIVVVTNQELPTVRSAARLVALLRTRYGKDRVSVAVSRYDEHADIGQHDLERAIGGTIKYLIPSSYRLALAAMNAGQPLAVGDHTALSGSLRALAHGLAGVDATKASRRGSSVLGLFRRPPQLAGAGERS